MIGAALRSPTGWRADDLVYRIDCGVFRGDPQRFLAHLQASWLSTFTMAGYLAFGGYLVYLFLAEAFVLTPATGRLQLGLMRLYGIGFSGYLLFRLPGRRSITRAFCPRSIIHRFPPGCSPGCSATAQGWTYARASMQPSAASC